METSTKTSTKPLPVSTVVMEVTVPVATPWYSPVGPFDWWQWQWYTTRSKKASVTILPTVTTTLAPSTLTTRVPATTATTTTTTTTVTRPTTTTTVATTTQRSSTTTVATTTTTTTSTRTSTTSATTIKSTTKKITTTVKPETSSASTGTTSTVKVVPMDWPNLPFKDSADMKKNPLNDVDKEYQEWLAYLTTNEIHGIITSTESSKTSLPLSPRQQQQQQQQQQGSSSTSTKSTWPSDHRVVTVNTPPAKRQHSQQSPGVSVRNFIAIPNNGKNVSIDEQGHSLGIQPMIESSFAVSPIHVLRISFYLYNCVYILLGRGVTLCLFFDLLIDFSIVKAWHTFSLLIHWRWDISVDVLSVQYATARRSLLVHHWNARETWTLNLGKIGSIFISFCFSFA